MGWDKPQRGCFFMRKLSRAGVFLFGFMLIWTFFLVGEGFIGDSGNFNEINHRFLSNYAFGEIKTRIVKPIKTTPKKEMAKKQEIKISPEHKKQLESLNKEISRNPKNAILYYNRALILSYGETSKGQ